MDILYSDTILGLFTVTVNGLVKKNKVGDIIYDEKKNKFRINSFAMVNTDKITTTLVLSDENAESIGKTLLVQ